MYVQKHSNKLLTKVALTILRRSLSNMRKTLHSGKKKMVKDNFYIVHIIKERGICPDISLFPLQVKMKGRETSHSEAEIV